MSERQVYIDSKGAECPFCGSVHFEGGSVETGKLAAAQVMSCMECEAVWTDRYIFSGLAVTWRPERSLEYEMEKALRAAHDVLLMDRLHQGKRAHKMAASVLNRLERERENQKAESPQGRESQADDSPSGSQEGIPAEGKASADNLEEES